MKNALLSLVFLILISTLATGLKAQKEIPSDFCLTEEEYRLAELINKHREENGIKPIPLSSCLSFVARTHVLDLFSNRPDTGICNLNSWSDKGNWTACCHNRYLPQENCIRNKPRELTKYVGLGYEITYAEESDVSADSVFKFWSSIGEADAFLLNGGSWKNKNWKALGVGIYRNYAVVWVGLNTDLEPKPETCKQMSEKKVKKEMQALAAGEVPLISQATGRFYIVVASFQSLQDARSGVKKLGNIPDANVCIVKNDQGQYRISVNDYETLEGAKNGKELYRITYDDAWILNY